MGGDDFVLAAAGIAQPWAPTWGNSGGWQAGESAPQGEEPENYIVVDASGRTVWDSWDLNNDGDPFDEIALYASMGAIISGGLIGLPGLQVPGAVGALGFSLVALAAGWVDNSPEFGG